MMLLKPCTYNVVLYCIVYGHLYSASITERCLICVGCVLPWLIVIVVGPHNEGDSLLRTIIEGRMEGKRTRGRPRLMLF